MIDLMKDYTPTDVYGIHGNEILLAWDKFRRSATNARRCIHVNLEVIPGHFIRYYEDRQDTDINETCELIGAVMDSLQEAMDLAQESADCSLVDIPGFAEVVYPLLPEHHTMGATMAWVEDILEAVFWAESQAFAR
jgi:hypothetical protein